MESPLKLKKMEILGDGPALGVASGAICPLPTDYSTHKQ